MRAALPIVLGYVPIGLAFGALARQIGLSLWQIGLMSAIVYAGSSQFIAVSLLGAGAGLLTIVATTFLVNLRHLLMSSALSPHLPRLSNRFLSLLAYGVTDETFALNITRLRAAPLPAFDILGVHLTAQTAWLLGSLAGGLLGNLIPPGSFGVDFALPAMFICLIVLQVRHRLDVGVVVLAGGLSLALMMVLPGSHYVAIVAAMAAATIGVAIHDAG
ncbi:MAG: AzlC family ABC transporter permease [Chloroflexi bacterium]|nr:AzlC family ABC transporter permease [Chloroflexota bacterium]